MELKKELEAIESRNPTLYENEVSEMLEDISRRADKVGQFYGVRIDVMPDGSVHYGAMGKTVKSLVETEMKRVFRKAVQKALARMILQEKIKGG